MRESSLYIVLLAVEKIKMTHLSIKKYWQTFTKTFCIEKKFHMKVFFFQDEHFEFQHAFT